MEKKHEPTAAEAAAAARAAARARAADPDRYNPDGTLKADYMTAAQRAERRNNPPQGFPTGPYEQPPLPADEPSPTTAVVENQSHPGPRKDPRKP